MTDSRQLLDDYARHKSEAAFRELVSRYLNLVYSCALRLVEGDAHRAEDVAQVVFADLARKAAELSPKVMLGGWLHRHTCFVAANTRRGERRRLAREREAVAMNSILEDNTQLDFARLAPLLDETINQLDETDRAAILLRFFEQKDFCSVGQALGSSEEASRKRVSRALDKLRDLLAQRGVRTTAAALSVIVSTNAVQSAPFGLAAAISTAALTGTAVTASTVIAATKTIAMTTLQKTAATLTVAALAGAGIYEARQAAHLRDQVQTFQQQQAPLSEQIARLQQERDQATNQLASVAGELAKTKDGNAELLKLRGEVGALRQQNEESLRENQALRQAQSTTGKTPPDETPVRIAKESWAFAGYATPEAALQTVMWAQLKGDANMFLASLGPEARAEIQTALQRKPDSVAAMFSAVSDVKDFTVLKTVSLSPDQTLLRVRTSMGDGTEKITLTTVKLVDGQWKVQSGRAE